MLITSIVVGLPCRLRRWSQDFIADYAVISGLPCRLRRWSQDFIADYVDSRGLPCRLRRYSQDFIADYADIHGFAATSADLPQYPSIYRDTIGAGDGRVRVGGLTLGVGNTGIPRRLTGRPGGGRRLRSRSRSSEGLGWGGTRLTEPTIGAGGRRVRVGGLTLGVGITGIACRLAGRPGGGSRRRSRSRSSMGLDLGRGGSGREGALGRWVAGSLGRWVGGRVGLMALGAPRAASRVAW